MAEGLCRRALTFTTVFCCRTDGHLRGLTSALGPRGDRVLSAWPRFCRVPDRALLDESSAPKGFGCLGVLRGF